MVEGYGLGRVCERSTRKRRGDARSASRPLFWLRRLSRTRRGNHRCGFAIPYRRRQVFCISEAGEQRRAVPPASQSGQPLSRADPVIPFPRSR